MAFMMNETPARRLFKSLSGNVNHFLITILIGLDAVRGGKVDRSPSFSASWQPHDVVRSANRSADFATKALVAWLVDALDAYVARLNRKPFLIQDAACRHALDAKGRSVMARTRWLAATYGLEETPAYGLGVLAVAWRNRLVHSGAETALPDSIRAVLARTAGAIADDFQGLDVERLLEDFGSSASPRFKEATALVRAVQLCVRDADRAVLESLSLNEYFREVLEVYVGEDPVRRAANVWGKDPGRRLGSLGQLAREAGLTESSELSDGTLSDDELLRFASLSAREARDLLVTPR
jgi:hypothetical protein